MLLCLESACSGWHAFYSTWQTIKAQMLESAHVEASSQSAVKAQEPSKLARNVIAMCFAVPKHMQELVTVMFHKLNAGLAGA